MYSMARHLGESSTSNAKAYVAAVKEWKKVDSHTVKAIMNYPNADLPTFTRMVIDLSFFVRSQGFYLVAVMVGIVSTFLYFK